MLKLYFVVLAVGKSCLLLQFTDKRFQPVHDLTIGKRICLLESYILHCFIYLYSILK